MRIAILTSGIMPVPAVNGGAVENLIDFYLDYNDRNKLHDTTIYSLWNDDVANHHALLSEVNHYKYINTNSKWYKVKKYLYKKLHKEKFYHYSVELYLDEVIKDIRSKLFDIIIIENRPGFILYISKRIKSNFILHLHNDFLNKDTLNASEIVNSYLGVVCVSDFITNRVNQIKSNHKKCITIHNAIDIHSFHQAEPIKRESLGLNENDFVIVYSGRLTKEKGILQLIKALKKTNMPQNLKLLIIGASGYGKDLYSNSFVKELEEESTSINDKVIFTGFVDYIKIPSHLKTADIAVVPSMWDEPFGLTVVEAMAAGLPLITTRSGGIPEICEGVATIIERENVVKNLANAILDLYQHPQKREAMSKASLERSKLFDKDTYAKNLFSAIEMSFS